MKALRKCAYVAVQLVVTTALLFQQCPVQAIALGLEQGSDYVEIPASEEDADAENDSSDAPSNDGNSNEAAPASPEKDEAASGADSVVGADNAIQNTQSDDDATNSGDATPASVSDEELVWNRLGTLEWSKDANKNVILRPADGAQSASYEGWISASDLFGKNIRSFKTEGLLSLGSISFFGCKAIRAISLTNVSVKGSTNRMFEGCSSLAALDLSSFDTSSVTYMESMFRGCSSLTSLDLSSFDTTSVTGMPYMFEGCSSLVALDLSSFDTSSVEYMWDMFSGCSSLAALDLSSFDTSSVTDMLSMFEGCSSLGSIDLSSFDTSSVTRMSYMFKGCSSLTSLDLTSFNTSSVASMEGMFTRCSSLTSLELSTFDTSSVSDMGYMFSDCATLKSLDISSFDTRAARNCYGCFHGMHLGQIKVGANCSENLANEISSTCKGFRVSWENSSGVSFARIPAFIADVYKATASLDEARFSVDLSDEFFTGKPIVKQLSSLDGLTEKEDFTICYSDNVDCGIATLKVVGLGVFRGEQVFNYVIKKAPAGYTVPSGLEAVYGQRLSDVKLPEGFSWEDPSLSVGDPGENTFKCEYAAPDDNHTGAEGIEAKVRVTRPVEASMFSVDARGLAYTGKAHEPAVSSKVVPEGSFSVSYRDNVAAGKAAAVVKGSGFYTGTCEVPFSIAKAKPTFKAPTGLKAAYGQKLSDVKLPEGFSWEDPSLSVGDPGENTFKCRYAAPDDNHTGAEGIEVKVCVIRTVEPSMFSVDADGLVYTGKAHEPAVSSSVVPEGSFTVSYRDNVAAGKAAAVVKGSGFYTGTCEVPFSIAKAKPAFKAPTGLEAVYGQNLSDVKLPEGFTWEDPSLSVGDPGENAFKCNYAAPDGNHTGADGIEVKVRVTRPVEASMFSVDAEGLVYTGKAHEPAVSSEVVPEGSFSVSYRDNVAAGEAAAVVKGSGFYTGTCEVPFTIAKAKPSYTVPATLKGVYGKKLSDVKLPEGFSWSDPSMRIDWYGSKSIEATFTPSDTKNYEVVKGIEVSVIVGRSVIAVPTIKELVYSGSVQAPSVSIDGIHVVKNAGGVNVGEYSVELALDDPVLDCWKDGTTENKKVEYRILPADINSADIAPISPCLLKNGRAEPGVSVTFGGQELSVDKDFDVSYFDNGKVGTASVTIKGKGNFTGEKTVYFQIAKGDLGECLVSTKQNVYPYKGSAIEPRVFVSTKVGGAVLREGVDYKVTYANNNALGTGHATINGMGDYIGSSSVDFAIVDTIDLSTYCTAHAYDAFYTGGEVCPRVDVRLNTESYDEAYGNGGASRSEDAPIEGQDYTVSYEDNVEPGMATAVVRGRGRYVGEVRVQFHILRKSDFDLSDCSVRLDPPSGADRYSYALKGGEYSFLYTGSAVEPDVSVSLYGGSGIYVELRAGVDYELDYRSNTEPGSATVAVRGINGLSGSQSLGFNVVRKLSVADLLLTKYDFEQSVYQLKPGFALAPKLKVSSSFIEGADYTLSYSNCDKAGNGLVTVTGIGRYAGNVVIEVPIVESLDRPLLSDCCFGKIEDQVYTGSEIYPSVVLKNSSGVEVDQTKECSLRYSNNVNVGKATVTASESASSSSYIGETSTNFNILPADIDDAYFAPIGDEIYTGNAIKPDVLVRFNGKTLVKDIDYDLSYSDNVEVGTAHVVVTGKGNFGGKREMTFNIVRPVIEFEQDMVEGKTVSTRWTSKVNTTNYRIVLDRGGMVRIRTGFLGIDTILCSIRNENGDPIDAWAPSDGMVYGFFALPAGTYYFEYVGSPKAYGGSVYASYSVTRFGEPANTIYEAEDNSGTADGHTIAGDATPVEVGRFFAGSNYYATTDGFGDIDYFKFTVARRGRYSMSLATSARLMFALTDAQGNILNNRDTGSSIVAQSGTEQLAGLDFGTLEPGTYYVRVLSTDRAAVGSPYYGFIFDSSEPESAERGVGRVSGDTRYDTMASLAGRGNWAVGGSVILASGANYPDALAASSLAGGLDAPILLTDPNGLSDAARGRLESLCPSRLFIVGGNAAVSPDVERQVKELLGFGCAVFRVAGQTRYETSLVAAEINPKSSDTVIVATGGNYADALSVSPYAFASGSPVLLCDSASGLAGAAVESIRSGGYSRAVIVGGTAAVPASVEGQLQSAGIRDVTRLSGATRFETSSRIADFELASGLGFSMDGVLLATGMNFPDALSAGPLAGRSRSPLLLVDPGAEYACAYLSGFRGEVGSATVVGGTAAVPEEDRLAIARVLGI